MRGLGQGATLGWGDELIPLLTPTVDDGTGIPREYAAGSANADQRAMERRENQTAQDKFPTTYRAGQIAGGVPSSIAMSGIGAGAGPASTVAEHLARIASGGLAAGARGGIEGAGLANEGNRLKGAAQAAGPSAALGAVGAAAPAAVNAVKNLFKGGPPSGPLPALAMAAGRAEPSAAEVARGAQAARGAGTSAGPMINRAVVPPKPPGGAPPAKTVPPPRRGMVDKEAAGGRQLGPEETKTMHDALPPPMGDEPPAFTVPKSQRLPRIEHLDFDGTASPVIDQAPTPRGVTNAPKALMGSEPPMPIEPPLPGRPTVPSAALAVKGPKAPFVEPNGPPTVPPDAVTPEANAALQGERAPFLPESDVVEGHGPKTNPPGSLTYDQAMGPVRERSRNAMLPPSTDEALDRSLISGGPSDARIPTEMTGRMPPPRTNFNRLPNETDAKMNAQIAIQDAEDRAALHQAQGKDAGDHLRSRPDRSGQSMFDADQLAGKPHPKMPSEYAKPERPTGGYYSEFPEGHPQHGEGKTAVTNEFGEYDLGPASGAKKKTDVKKLMKKRPDDSDD